MNYYIDTEFIDHQKQHSLLGVRVGKPVSTTELISIALVAEDGREYYAVCNEFDLDAAWSDKWVRLNVLNKLHEELCRLQPVYAKTYHYDLFEPFAKKSLRYLLKCSAKTRYQIRQDMYGFINEAPVFYGYFADYDWVVFCHLFGRMIDLPSGFPMYCRDLKQMMDERGLTSQWKHQACPDPAGEHHALDDARWNRDLHRAIQAEGYTAPDSSEGAQAGEAASSGAAGDTAEHAVGLPADAPKEPGEQQGRPDLHSGEPVAWMDDQGHFISDAQKRAMSARTLRNGLLDASTYYHIPLYRSAPEVDALKVDSTTLIGDVKERWGQLRERGEDGPHALTEDPWRSFYGGWIEGRADLLKFIRTRLLSGPSGSGEETTKPNE